MAEDNKDILLHYEIEAIIENLEPTKLEDFGTKKWFEFHKKLMLLSQQSILEVSDSRTEVVKEWFVTFQKIIILIHEAIQISVWKRKVYHHLIDNNNQPTNTFMLYSVFYHENISISLLENILYHCDSVESLDDSALDLVDYAVDYITRLVFQKKDKSTESSKNIEDISCLEELSQKKMEIEFDIGIKCISIIGYFARFLDNLPLSILKRILKTHDVPYLFCQLIENKPWKKINENNEIMIYNSTWEKVEKKESDKICRAEGQVWLGLRELLLNPKSGPYYEITEFRMTELIKLQKYLHEKVLDQIAPLMDLRRWLSYLNISSQTDHTKSSALTWKKIAKIQAETLFSKNIDYIKSMAEILSGAYDLDKLFLKDIKQCALCRRNATKKCSKCKNIFYCGRECQVKDWTSHKNTCNS
ncbi:hypothetical protein HCN44_009610 [Aphidius gifuensis]|uniref:Zinc finger MYND domain-containing protein 10 n=1 Tax=Aphidius gifuensis TaxID=684658 RepID=A0A834Y7P8_APHGI|nr:hypothetical protein HCN44_009610 [Aphidius gifuensis]